MDQVLAHLIGDYVFQTHWMSAKKTSKWLPALAHGATYTLPFLALTRDPRRLLIIGGTHVVIDRFRLAKHVAWAKNQLAPAAFRPGHTATGYADDVPDWLKTWLMIITDNTMHLTINRLALGSSDDCTLR